MHLIKKYFPSLSSRQYQQFGQLDGLYDYWNQRINVISRKDVSNLYLHHVLHSLAIARFTGFTGSDRILDVGTGGGFPGIPLAIMFPDAAFTLLDSVRKKILVVESIRKELSLDNVNVAWTRVEQYTGAHDYIVSRAVESLGGFVRHTRHALAAGNGGIIYLKGGDLRGELKSFAGQVQETAISDYFEEPFFKTKKIIYLPANLVVRKSK